MRKTPLNAAHRASGAKMVPFGGWDMPVEYSGLISEHMAVRTAAGLFDVSHMGEFEVEGPGALAFLQRTTANNVAKLVDGQAQYSAFPMPNGAPVDDVIVYRRAADRYLLVVNAGNIEKDFRWLQQQGPQDLRLENKSDNYALVALQGPRAVEILQPLTALDLSALKYYHFADAEVDSYAVTVSRTGYTGEDGFEIFVPPQLVEAFWKRLLDAGREKGLVPAGLGARDTLRLEARMCLYGQDMDETTSPLESALGWTVDLASPRDFVGKAALAGRPPQRQLVGLLQTGAGGILRAHQPVQTGAGVGEITSGTFSPTLGKSIALARVPAGVTIGEVVDVEIRDKRVAARVVKPPFVRHGKALVE
jgi:aminomethyltransferase